MYCISCSEQLPECKCPDKGTKLKAMRDDPSSHIMTKWCVGCDNHWSSCKCETPRFRIYSRGKQVDPRKIRSLSGQSIHDLNPDIEIPEEFLESAKLEGN